jgi:nucleotide-binding universal stress UspA family protein
LQARHVHFWLDVPAAITEPTTPTRELTVDRRLRRVVIALDLAGTTTARLVERVAALPLAPQARVTLVHAAASVADVSRARDELSRVATQLPTGLVIAPAVEVGSAAVTIDEIARSTDSELVVLGRGPDRALRDSFLGSTAEQVLRATSRPVLLVRESVRGPYRQPFAALDDPDLDAAARPALAMLLRVLAPPRPPISLVHVFELPYGNLIASQGADRLEPFRQRALRQLRDLHAEAVAASDGAEASSPRCYCYAYHGSPRTIVPSVIRRRRADLLALGSHARSGIARAFLGSVAGDLLRSVGCDVLVVPPR